MTKKNKEPKFYETSDLGLASALIVYHRPLARTKQSVDQRYIFVFEEDDDLPVIVKGYWDRYLKAEPQALFEAQKSLKNRIYGERLSN